MKKIVVAVLAITAIVPPAAAEAGTYHVYSCSAAGRTWPNNAWRPSAAAAGVAHDTNCAGGIGLAAGAGARMANNTARTLTFRSPTGTTIVDFTFTRHIRYTNPIAEDTHRYYLLYTLGGTHFAGGGDCCNPTRNHLNSLRAWYGYPQSNFTIARSTVTRRSFLALDAYTGDANQLQLRLGCFDRGSPCSVASGGRIEHWLHGSDITINDPTRPNVTVEASGLLAGGPRNGSDPVTLTATDNSGIRKVELIDVTDPAAPRVVGVEDYAETRTRTNRICDYSQPAPCPTLSRETIVASSLETGQRRVLIRVTDTGGNVTNRGPYTVGVQTPSNRGPLNGVNATETATLDVRFTRGSKRSRTLRYRDRAGVRGRLVNSFGVPIVGARVALLTRDLRRNAPLVLRETLTTDADGRFRTTVRASASRLMQFGWVSHVNDVRFAANGYLTLRARASASLRVSTRRPRLGRRFTISGRLRGVSRRNVTVIVQGRARGQRRYSTFADTTTTRSGRFRVRYRFRDSASRGRRFVFRARIRPSATFPYETGYSRRVTVRVR